MKQFIYILFLYISLIISLIYCYDTRCKYVTSAFQPLDCFELAFSSSKIEKCCLLEYKDKEKNRKYRRCEELTLEQFLDIEGTIENLENENTNITITSLECDKSYFLSFNNCIILFFLLLII